VIALWTELGACVARAGVKKLLLFNGHGGNVAVMDIVARELRQRHGLLVYSASWFSLPQPPEVQACSAPKSTALASTRATSKRR
jgi:creatinine amidohydrolase